ncbi:unnamed protein product [Adineta ricciae]|uniref:Uncharacterized protein n=1 Tax=Adineta ricciae TaxID=249248 RepID=A0A815Q1X1_ADIRI|nr:unnamed protein product [Adineta ricciae]
MNQNQPKLYELWRKNAASSDRDYEHIPVVFDSHINVSSSNISSTSATTITTVPVPLTPTFIIIKNICSSTMPVPSSFSTVSSLPIVILSLPSSTLPRPIPGSSASTISCSHNKTSSLSSSIEVEVSVSVTNAVDKHSTARISTHRSNHRTQYLSKWETQPEAQYLTHVLNNYGVIEEKFVCWLYLENNSMFCRLCQRHGMKINSNKKDNVWCTTGMTTLSYDKIEHHKNESIVHKEADKQELLLSSQAQPNWHIT